LELALGYKSEAVVMKRRFILITGLMLLIFLSGCGSGVEQNIFGVYTFEEVSYLSPLSSSSKDFMNRQMEGSKFTVREDLIKIESLGYTVEYSHPKYVKEKIPDETTLFSDVRTFIGSDVDYQYTIYDKDDNKTMWRLYVSSDCLWIGNYNDNTQNGSEIIIYIYINYLSNI